MDNGHNGHRHRHRTAGIRGFSFQKHFAAFQGKLFIRHLPFMEYTMPAYPLQSALPVLYACCPYRIDLPMAMRPYASLPLPRMQV